MMSAQEETLTQPRPGYAVCRICGREIRRPKVIIHDRIFCKDHAREYKIRRREGVTAAELDERWSDTLSTWRDRPPALDQEVRIKVFMSPLFFRQRYEDWLLFVRYYGHWSWPWRRHRSTVMLKKGKRRKSRSPFKYRGSDVLAVNMQSGEIRRFVDVQIDEVLNELRGVRPVLYQAEVAAFWANSKPTGRQERVREQFERQFRDEQYHILVSNLVHLATFPVYGLARNPLDLSVSGLSTSSNWWEGHITSVGFNFASPRSGEVRRHFEIHSSSAKERNIIDLEQDTIPQLKAQLSLRYRVQQQVRQQEQIEIGDPTTWEGEMTIAGANFSVKIYYWSQPQLFTHFYLKNEECIISGETFGLIQDELMQLLQGLQVVNQDADLLAQYQRELDENRPGRYEF